MKKFLILLVVIAMVIGCFTGCSTDYLGELDKLIEADRWDEAYQYIVDSGYDAIVDLSKPVELEEWDSKAETVAIKLATPLYENGQYEEAEEIFLGLTSIFGTIYGDGYYENELFCDIQYKIVEQYINEGDYEGIITFGSGETLSISDRLESLMAANYPGAEELYNEVEAYTEQQETIQLEQQKTEYKTVSYDSIARNPEDYEGEKVKIYGRIGSLWDYDSELILCTGITEYGNYIEDEYMVYYENAEMTSKLLRDDMVTVYATGDGWNSTHSIPQLKADIVVLGEE